MPSDKGAADYSTKTASASFTGQGTDSVSDSLSDILDNQTLRTNPFGDNISAEYLYRRAERIAAAVHLVTSHVREDEPVRIAAREESVHLLKHALSVRGELRAHGSENVRKMRESIRALISLVRMLGVAGHISSQNVSVLAEALDELGNATITSQRSALAESVPLTRSSLIPRATHTPKSELAAQRGNLNARSSSVRHPSRPAVIKDKTVSQKDGQVSRTGRIMDILRTGGVLGIKDITSNLPEYSEKMIQRDLAVLVGQALVKKTGAKRWSKYEVAQR